MTLPKGAASARLRRLLAISATISIGGFSVAALYHLLSSWVIVAALAVTTVDFVVLFAMISGHCATPVPARRLPRHCWPRSADTRSAISLVSAHCRAVPALPHLPRRRGVPGQDCPHHDLYSYCLRHRCRRDDRPNTLCLHVFGWAEHECSVPCRCCNRRSPAPG